MDAELYIIVVVDLGSDREIFDMFSISLIKTVVEKFLVSLWTGSCEPIRQVHLDRPCGY